MVELEFIRRYYKKHAPIYDLTRSFFLFGRKLIAKKLTEYLPLNSSVLEIGVGTGYILKKMFSGKDLQLNGIDISPEMLERVPNSINKFNNIYKQDSFRKASFDCILLSYIFTLKENNTDELIDNIKYHLKENGILAVVDFHKASPLYDKFMRSQNIIIDPELFERLKKEFEVKYEFEGIAWFGIWRYRVMVLSTE